MLLITVLQVLPAEDQDGHAMFGRDHHTLLTIRFSSMKFYIMKEIRMPVIWYV